MSQYLAIQPFHEHILLGVHVVGVVVVTEGRLKPLGVVAGDGVVNWGPGPGPAGPVRLSMSGNRVRPGSGFGNGVQLSLETPLRISWMGGWASLGGAWPVADSLPFPFFFFVGARRGLAPWARSSQMQQLRNTGPPGIPIAYEGLASAEWRPPILRSELLGDDIGLPCRW